MPKRGYTTYEEAAAEADRQNARARNSRLPLPEYEGYHYRDPVTGEQKWLLRRKRT